MRTKRIIAAIIGACIVAGLLVLGTLIWSFGPLVGSVIAGTLAAAVVGVYVAIVGPWQRRWGATDLEVRRAMPGDDLLPPSAPSTTRVIEIDASPEDVFPWLLQIGYGRGGWYSYDWIDNDGRPSADQIDPALRFDVGDRIEMMPGLGPTVRWIEPDHAIVSAGDTDSWSLVVEPTANGGSRLISRWRQDWPKSIGTSVWIAVTDPGAFVMEQRMLRTIRDRAEARSG